PESLPSFAGAMLDLAKVTGSQDARVNRGLLLAVGGLSRVSEPSQQAANIPKALIGVRGFGASTAGAAALWASLSTMGADTEGAMSRTGAIALAQQLEMFLPAAGAAAETTARPLTEAEALERERNRKALARARLRQAAGGQLTGAEIAAIRREERFAQIEAGETKLPARPGIASMEKRLEYLWANPELAKSFYAAASFEKAVEAPIRDLLTDPNSPIAKLYRKELGMLPSNAGLIAEGGRMVSAVRGEPLAVLAGTQRMYAQTQEELLLGNLIGASGAVNREGLRTLLEASGMGATATRAEMLGFEARSGVGTTGGYREATAILRRRQGALQRPWEVPIPSEFDTGGGAYQRAPSESERRNAELLGKAAAMLMDAAKTLKDQQRPPTLERPTMTRETAAGSR
ncbi:MAG: hypothetical protein HY718_04190, partial [Planctomycetes bacterium]|nr:hypothetical protein [Planctomycetota bacterium]